MNAVTVIHLCFSLQFLCRTQLVGYSQETVSEIKKCIDDWIIGGKAVGQTFMVGNANLTVSLLASCTIL